MRLLHGRHSDGWREDLNGQGKEKVGQIGIVICEEMLAEMKQPSALSKRSLMKACGQVVTRLTLITTVHCHTRTPPLPA